MNNNVNNYYNNNNNNNNNIDNQVNNYLNPSLNNGYRFVDNYNVNNDNKFQNNNGYHKKEENKNFYMSIFLILLIGVIVFLFLAFKNNSNNTDDETIDEVVYNIIFNSNGALNIGSDSLSCVATTKDGCGITMPSITPKQGYEIIGWSENIDATSASYLPNNTYVINSNITLYAITQQSKSIKEFGITFNKNNALKIENTYLSCKTSLNNCNITMPSITAQDGYEVIGWNENKDATVATYLVGKSYTIDSNKTLYAITKYLDNSKTYTIKFDKNSASSIGSNNLSCSTTSTSCSIKMPSITAKEGYEVIGWSTTSNSTKADYLPNNTYEINKNITLYAITKQKVNNKTYTIKFDKNTASSISSNSLSCTTTSTSCSIKMPSITAKEGYEVIGWSTISNGTKADYLPNNTYEINKNITLYAITNDLRNKLIALDKYVFNAPVPDKEKKVLKVLIIDIDPIMTKGSIEGVSCSGKTASQCLGQNKQQVINELITDIEYSSHGIIDVQIVKTDKLNEFSTNKTKTTLINGTKSNRLDEDTWLSVMKGGWYGFWDNEIVKNFGSYTFDYEYLINKLNLVNRRNNNEFNEVWLVNVDPSATYESMMVGRTAYWINGEPIIKNCDNFRIMNVSISRPDTNFECNGHAAENIMSRVFGTVNPHYAYNEINVNSSNYNNLTLWEKFTLTENTNMSKNTGLVGPGNVHFSPNSTSDYNWENYDVKVASKWREWINYPNLTNKSSTEIFSPSVYMNVNLTGEQSAARKHHRWWFSLMPHVSGFTSDGYSNNWWDYLYLSNYINQVSVNSSSQKVYQKGDYIDDIYFDLKYQNNTVEKFRIQNYENNMSFSNKSILRIDGTGKILAYASGTTNLTYYRDGKSATVTITIK